MVEGCVWRKGRGVKGGKHIYGLNQLAGILRLVRTADSVPSPGAEDLCLNLCSPSHQDLRLTFLLCKMKPRLWEPAPGPTGVPWNLGPIAVLPPDPRLLTMVFQNLFADKL